MMRNNANQGQYHDDYTAEMLRTNLRQKQHYEADDPHFETRSTATSLWARTRLAMQAMRQDAAIDDDVLEMHRRWLGDLSGKKVLDLGCFAGNPLSMHLARTSASYLGLDLSERAVSKLNRKLVEAGLYGPRTKALAEDFLSPTFYETRFDVVYALSVLHHFRHLEVALRMLHDKLAPGGVVVTWDPMQTSLPVRAVRMVYRPFQSDKDWEYPFTRHTFRCFQEYFVIEDLQGILGRSKWAFLIAPFGAGRAARLARRWHERDLGHANKLGTDLWRCMQVAMKLRRM
jgi:2-polyprenyl-3-methyl-5-hydroxy-6-metoxy-1,4-benzoquinol methylase